MDKLPKVNIQGEDGKWYHTQPMEATVRGGRAVIYVSEEGIEIKREPLVRYRARELRAATTPVGLDKKIKESVDGIVDDMCKISDLKTAWNKLSHGLQEEMKESWFSIIKNNFK